TIAGEFWKGEEETRNRITELGLNDQIELRPRYHTDQETAELFHRADVVVLPYRSATGSGVVPIAYHYNKPVIVTNVGGLPDVVEDMSTGFIISRQDVSSLARIIDSLTALDCKKMVKAIMGIKNRLTWKALVETI
ncbi:MAG: glycosyl transferase family 1, partial [Gammaproteobacteria bacterium]